MNEIAELCADLREIADCMPPGLTRDGMQADLQTLRARLAALPGRVAARAAMRPTGEVKLVLDQEFADAFAGIMQWFEPIGRA
jgi:hypothetical protein